MKRALPVFALLLACKGDKDGVAVDDTGSGPAPYRPDLVCPGDAGCETNSGALLAGASAVDITPACFETWDDLDGSSTYSSSHDTFFDCGCDRLCPGDEGYPGPDDYEADGEFKGVWIAGFGSARAAQDIHDPTWARAIALRSGDTTVALISLDAVGWFNNDVDSIREKLVADGVDVDHITLSSTHTHETADTLGQWGPRLGKSGVDADHRAQIIAGVAQAVTEAVAALEPATMKSGVIDSAAPFPETGTRNTVRDSRDPVVIEERVYTAHFARSDGSTIATLINWGNHPEAIGSENLSLSSDFAHYLRQGVEEGVSWESGDQAGLGGVAIYFNASVGGLMTPLGVTVTDFDGVAHEGETWEKTEALGKVIASLALQAVAESSVAADPTVSVRAQRLYVPVENYGFQALFLVGVFDRPTFNYDPEQDINERNTPELLTEVNLVTVGPITMLSVPGEATPELSIGGYDGSRVNSPVVDFLDPTNPNPPDVSLAPAGPYWKEQMGGEHQWILGLGNDEIGYLIPPYDYELHPTSPYLIEADGDHYEETNSVGPSAVPLLQEAVTAITTWAP
jgi:hypothetical protein